MSVDHRALILLQPWLRLAVEGNDVVRLTLEEILPVRCLPVIAVAAVADDILALMIKYE